MAEDNTTVQETELDKKFAEGADEWMGQRMDNGSEGCCEAATKIGSHYSKFLAHELDNGVVYVPTLIADAGDLYMPLDESNLEKGDCIIYDSEEHVVLFDGIGGYVGNSTSLVKVIHGGDFHEMGGLSPTHMIKTGGKSSSKYVGSGSASKGGGSSQSDASCEVKTRGPIVIVSVKPKGKTFCEPIHPDLIAVTGNVPKALASNYIKRAQAEQPPASDTGIYNISLTKLENMTGINFTGFFSDTQTIAKSQQVFDPTKFKTEKKAATKGRPVNNTDPYPVDQKIDELETHQPRVKLQEIQLTKPSSADITNAKATLMVADKAEKRIVKLENMVSTLYRYVFGMGSRMMINCVYYGGQSRYQKYKEIRCMRDDRVQDGAKMQIDQCLTCTRYEPIIGQTYEILDKEMRPPLNLVLDDLQMSYQGMENEIEGSRVESYHTESKKAEQAMEEIKARDLTEKDFSQIQKPGYVQDWKLTPVETQKPSINWKQDINDSDKPKGKLASYQYANAGSSISNGLYGNGCGIAAGNMSTIMEQNYKAMESCTDAAIVEYINMAKDYASDSRVSATIDNMNSYNYKDIIVRIGTEMSLDPLFLLAIAAQESSGTPSDGDGMFQVEGSGGSAFNIELQIKAGADHISGNIDTVGTNPILICLAYNWGSGASSSIIPSADGLWTSMFESIKTAADTTYPGEPHRIFYPASVVYLYIALRGAAGLTPLDQAGNKTSDTENLRFPFEQKDYQRITFDEEYSASITENGASAAAYDSFKINGDPVDIYGAGSGSVTEINNDVVTTSIPSQNITIIYQGVDPSLKNGDAISSSTKIGSVSSKLYLQVKDQYGATVDPETYFTMLNGITVGQTLKEIE